MFKIGNKVFFYNKDKNIIDESTIEKIELSSVENFKLYKYFVSSFFFRGEGFEKNKLFKTYKAAFKKYGKIINEKNFDRLNEAVSNLSKKVDNLYSEFKAHSERDRRNLRVDYCSELCWGDAYLKTGDGKHITISALSETVDKVTELEKKIKKLEKKNANKKD